VLHELFRTVAATRSGKALHPRGAVVTGSLVRHGLRPATGVAWLDEAGVDEVVVRFSRGGGLPAPLPDVLGLALRTTSPEGDPVDLLLSTTLGRRIPWPRRRVAGAVHSSIASFVAPSGPLLLGARTAGRGFLLAAASPRGPWRPFAELQLDTDPADADDRPITFEPVLHAVPGLSVPPRWRRLREPAYAGSRDGRQDHRPVRATER
jgi:hypothetical protein